MKYRLPILVLILSVVVYSCGAEIGGSCTYETFEVGSKVVDLKLNGDSIVEVEFELDELGKVSLDGSYLAYIVDPDFDMDQLKEPSAKFIISGERIKKGSCAPVYVKKVRFE